MTTTTDIAINIFSQKRVKGNQEKIFKLALKCQNSDFNELRNKFDYLHGRLGQFVNFTIAGQKFSVGYHMSHLTYSKIALYKGHWDYTSHDNSRQADDWSVPVDRLYVFSV